MFIDVDEIAELRKKVQLLTEENKCLKQRLKGLLEDVNADNLHLLRNIVNNYYEDLSGATPINVPIVIDKGGYYKLGAAIEECSVKQLREWSSECDELKSFEDSTKVLLLS